MSLLFIDGFEWAKNNIPAFDGAGRWSTASPSGSLFDLATPGRNGTGSSIIVDGTADMIHAIPDVTTMYVGFGFRTDRIPTTRGPIFEFTDAGASNFGIHMALWIELNGTFAAIRGVSTIGSGTFAIGVDTWVWVEIKCTIDDAAGVFEVRFNGSPTPDINLTSADTRNGGPAHCDAIKFQGSSSADFQYDDFYIADDAGGQDFLGDVEVQTLVADGAGTDADFSPSAGSNFENIEELPSDDDTTYNQSATVDHRDRFTHGDLDGLTAVVHGVQVAAWCRNLSTGDRQVRTLAHDGTTEGEGAAQSPSNSYMWLWDMFEDHPTDANPWTESEVNSGQFGYTIES